MVRCQVYLSPVHHKDPVWRRLTVTEDWSYFIVVLRYSSWNHRRSHRATSMDSICITSVALRCRMSLLRGCLNINAPKATRTHQPLHWSHTHPLWDGYRTYILTQSRSTIAAGYLWVPESWHRADNHWTLELHSTSWLREKSEWWCCGVCWQTQITYKRHL